MKFKKSGLFIIIISLITLVLCSCTTMSDSLILGIGSGAAVGAAISPQEQHDRGKNAAIGAAVGGLSAYLIHKGIKKREEKIRRETLLNLDKFDVSKPTTTNPTSIPTSGGHFLTKPVVDMEWIETQAQGERLIEGHRVWKIIEKPKWIPSSESDKGGKQ